MFMTVTQCFGRPCPYDNILRTVLSIAQKSPEKARMHVDEI